LPCDRAGSAGDRLNQSDIVFIFLDPVETGETCEGLVNARCEARL
jgi:hypothetical protein